MASDCFCNYHSNHYPDSIKLPATAKYRVSNGFITVCKWKWLLYYIVGYRNNLKPLHYHRICSLRCVQLGCFPAVPSWLVSCLAALDVSVLAALWSCRQHELQPGMRSRKMHPIFWLESHRSPHGFHAIASCVMAWLLRASHNELQTAELRFPLDPLSYQPLLTTCCQFSCIFKSIQPTHPPEKLKVWEQLGKVRQKNVLT